MHVVMRDSDKMVVCNCESESQVGDSSGDTMVRTAEWGARVGHVDMRRVRKANEWR